MQSQSKDFVICDIILCLYFAETYWKHIDMSFIFVQKNTEYE